MVRDNGVHWMHQLTAEAWLGPEVGQSSAVALMHILRDANEPSHDPNIFEV